MSLGTKPASTAAREAPTAAPSLSATLYSSWKLSPFCMPRPPETMTFAAVSSGRSDLAISSPTKREIPASLTLAMVSMLAEPPSPATASKPVPRTVSTLTAALDCTVAMALPA
ncbi:hypothetical protein D3C80_1911780 [compost metagenome]